MATLAIAVPDAVMPRVIDALCASGNRPEDSPLTKAQFAHAQLIAYVTNITRNHEAREAGKAAEAQARQRAETEIVMTEGADDARRA